MDGLIESTRAQVGTVHAEDVMDDGSPIRLAVTIDRTDGSATFDFEGATPQQRNLGRGEEGGGVLSHFFVP